MVDSNQQRPLKAEDFIEVLSMKLRMEECPIVIRQLLASPDTVYFGQQLQAAYERQRSQLYACCRFINGKLDESHSPEAKTYRDALEELLEKHNGGLLEGVHYQLLPVKVSNELAEDE